MHLLLSLWVPKYVNVASKRHRVCTKAAVLQVDTELVQPLCGIGSGHMSHLWASCSWQHCSRYSVVTRSAQHGKISDSPILNLMHIMGFESVAPSSRPEKEICFALLSSLKLSDWLKFGFVASSSSSSFSFWWGFWWLSFIGVRDVSVLLVPLAFFHSKPVCLFFSSDSSVCWNPVVFALTSLHVHRRKRRIIWQPSFLTSPAWWWLFTLWVNRS